MATLIPSLVTLRAEFNQLCPDRDKASDGWIGDEAHQGTTSDHNPDARGLVHAIDVDADLKLSDLTMADVVGFLVGRCRAGAERRLRYVIFNRVIYSANNGWQPKAYTGTNPHQKHAHFSGSYDPVLERSTIPWHLEEIPVSLTAADKQWIKDVVVDEVAKVAELVWNHTEPDPAGGPDRRTGGDIRYMDFRARARHQEVLDAIAAAGAPEPPAVP